MIFFSKVKGLPQTGDHVTITPRGNGAIDITKVFSHMLKGLDFFHGLLADALDAGLLLGQGQGGERESIRRPPCSLCQVRFDHNLLLESNVEQDLQRRDSTICCQEEL